MLTFISKEAMIFDFIIKIVFLYDIGIDIDIVAVIEALNYF